MLLGQDTLEKFLHAALAKFGCQVELGSELISFEQADDRVHAKLTKPAPEGGDRVIENASFDWVIGTDGARGIVRKLLGLSFLGETRTMENMVVGDIHVEGLSPEVSFDIVLPFVLILIIEVARCSTGIYGEMQRLHCMFYWWFFDISRLLFLLLLGSAFAPQTFQQCSILLSRGKTSTMQNSPRMRTHSESASSQTPGEETT